VLLKPVELLAGLANRLLKQPGWTTGFQDRRGRRAPESFTERLTADSQPKEEYERAIAIRAL
jgi:hypothetical protein